MKNRIIVMLFILVSLIIASCDRNQRGWGGSRGIVVTPLNEKGIGYSGLCEYNRNGTINQVILLAESVKDYNRFYSQTKEQARPPEPFGVYYWNRDMNGFWVDGVYISTDDHPCYVVFYGNNAHVAIPIPLSDNEVEEIEKSRNGSGRLFLPTLVKKLDSAVREWFEKNDDSVGDALEAVILQNESNE